MKSNRRIRHRQRIEFGIIGALVLCHVGFFVMRKFEFIPEIKQENREQQASIIAINIKPPPPIPKPQQLPPEPIIPKKIAPKPGPIKPVSDSNEEALETIPETFKDPAPIVRWIPRDKEPQMIGDLKLYYPDWARKVGMEGTAYVHALISLEGEVVEATIAKSSGYDILDDEAVRAVKKSHWQPALQGDDPVRVWVMVPIKFLLHK